MTTETTFQRANRLAEERKAAARARGGIDYSRYEPLAKGEPLEARDSVEAEVWEQIEWEARWWHDVPDVPTVEDLVREVLEEMRRDAQRKRTLKDQLAARQLTLNFVDMGEGETRAVLMPLKAQVALAAPS